MTFIQNVMNSLYSESALARRERRLIDRLIVDETVLNNAQQELEVVCGKNVIDVTQMKQLEKEINDLVVKITAELKDLLAKESVELQKDVESPQENLSHVLIAVETYLKYLTQEKTISKTAQKQFKQLLDHIGTEFEALEEILEKVISESGVLFTSIYQQKGTRGFQTVDFNKFLAAGDVFEKNKVALSQTIKSLYKKLHNLEKELRKEINRYQRERKKTVKYTIADLGKKQRAAIVAAHGLLVQRGTTTPLAERDQQKIKLYIFEALQLETKIIQEMNTLGIPSKLDQAVREQTGQAKKQFQTVVNKLKYYKTNSGVYPFEFWLGEKRALGFLNANDQKNLGWLKELLEQGLLHAEYGMLSERDSGMATLVAEGFLNTAHDEFLNYLQVYQKGFLELTTAITKRAEIAQQVFAVLGSTIYHTEKVIEQTRSVTETAVKKAEEDEKKRDHNPANIIRAKKLQEEWDREQAEEERAIAAAQKKLQDEAGEMMATLGVVRGVEQKSRLRGLSFLQRALMSLALASQLIASSTSPAVLTLTPTKATAALSHEAAASSPKVNKEQLPQTMRIPTSILNKISSFFKAEKDAMLMITEKEAYSTPQEHTAVMAEEHEVIDPFLEQVKEGGIKIEYYPGEQLMLVYTKEGKLITNFRVRGGPIKGYVDPNYTDHYYGSTPAGTFIISQSAIKPYIKRNSSWYKARIKWGALIREVEDGEIQVSENGGKKWFYATGKKAKVKSFDKEDFYRPDGTLMTQWLENPFGHLTIELKTEKGAILAEKIHPNADLEKGKQMEETKISHGCMHIAPTNIDALARLILLSPGKVRMKIYPYIKRSDAKIDYVKTATKPIRVGG